ncbi:hypothetical protein [Methanofollis ethanolicus]|uniref:hypothetical protein n=1 Tax=Methanofollis ethanolicus TaxID=488124 RepID=UPI00128F89B5|nr:hypothetical protein [Methanofollis ethanolicus]
MIGSPMVPYNQRRARRWRTDCPESRPGQIRRRIRRAKRLTIAERDDAVPGAPVFPGRDRKKRDEHGANKRNETVQTAGRRPELPIRGLIPRGRERKLVATIAPIARMRGMPRRCRFPAECVRVRVAPARETLPRRTGRTARSAERVRGAMIPAIWRIHG